MSHLTLLRLGSVLLTVCSAVLGRISPKNATKPNFVFILTDDQDQQLASTEYMPLLQKHLGQGGTFYRKHYCTIAICCPSRVSLLTGKAAHNTNVTDVSPPYGGYPKFISQGFNNDYLPVWLQNEGYSTYYTGKLMNSHTVSNWNNPFPGGWTAHDYPGTYNYWNATFQRNQSPPRTHPGEYNSDLLKGKAIGFLNEAINQSKPFFVGIAPVAPHSDFTGSGKFSIPKPAPRHAHLFANISVPRTYNFNPEQPSGAGWIRNLPLLNNTQITYGDEWYRARLQTLQVVDEIIGEVVTSLERKGLLERTYIIYTSDNGFHISQHRLQPGKTCAFEEDINVPFYIRGPGVPKGEVTNIVTSHTDIVPTLFQLAGIAQRTDFDGLPIPVTKPEIKKAEKGYSREHLNVEFWGIGIEEGKFQVSQPNNTYKALRVIGDGYNLFYSVWCHNEHELYDVENDPGQMYNLAVSSKNDTQLLSRPLTNVQDRLDALLLVLKSCKADTCSNPWSIIHPDGDVRNFRDALDKKFDAYYKRQPKVSFSKCEEGYITASEGPQELNTFDALSSWPDWV